MSAQQESPFAEFDRYCERNNVSIDDTPKALEAWLREYHESPDVVGRSIPKGDGGA
jgi:hypothetical protein